MCGLLDSGDGEADEAADGTDPPDPEEIDEEMEPEGADDEAAPEADEDEASGDEGGSAEDDLDVEDTLKDLAARMSRLSSNLEGIQEDREQMEEKIDEFEDRLGELGNLAEVVSSRYNPFIAGSSPDGPDWGSNHPERASVQAEAVPVPETGDNHPPGSGAEPAEGAGLEDSTEELPAVPEEELAEDDAEDAAGAPEDEGAPEPAPEEGDPTGDEPFEELADRLDGPAEDEGSDPEDESGMAPLDLADAPDPTADDEDAFDRNVLMLEWVGHLIERVGREGLLDLLEYYENLGWLDEETKNTALRVATGIDAEGGDGDQDWRADTALHERSLVVLERLAGRERPANRLEEIQLDLRRLFDG